MYNAEFKISPFYNSQCFSFLGAGADNWSELDFFQDFSEVCEGDECFVFVFVFVFDFVLSSPSECGQECDKW